MNIQFNTDKNISGTVALEEYVSERINHGLSRFDEHVTRLEVHLSDQNAQKTGGDDIQCTLEARIEGSQPIAVTANDADKTKAVDQAIKKMKAALDTKLGKMREH